MLGSVLSSTSCLGNGREASNTVWCPMTSLGQSREEQIQSHDALPHSIAKGNRMPLYHHVVSCLSNVLYSSIFEGRLLQRPMDPNPVLMPSVSFLCFHRWVCAMSWAVLSDCKPLSIAYFKEELILTRADTSKHPKPLQKGSSFPFV